MVGDVNLPGLRASGEGRAGGREPRDEPGQEVSPGVNEETGGTETIVPVLKRVEPSKDSDSPSRQGVSSAIDKSESSTRLRRVPVVGEISSAGIEIRSREPRRVELRPNQPASQGDVTSQRVARDTGAAASIRRSAAVRAQAVEGIDQVMAVLESTEFDDTEGTVATLALVSLRRAKDLLTLDWDAVSDAIASEREDEINEIRSALERVLDWFKRKADGAATGVIVFALTQLLGKL